MNENIKKGIWSVVSVSMATVIFFFLQQKQQAEAEKSSVNYWQMFSGISLERKYIEEAGAYYRIPVFSPDLLTHSGKEITLEGYYLPFSPVDSVIILSRYPNASCFFCGQAGIESVAMVEMADVETYKTDQRLSVKGKLKLNATDVKRLAFIIVDASVEER